MRKIIKIFVLCSVFFEICHAQWVIQYDHNPQNQSLYDVSFINSNTGWACGDGGYILKTTNGGINWLPQNSGVTKILEGIHAVDSHYVYCVGWWQTVIKTTNGGDNWIIIRNGPDSAGYGSFYGLYFLNQNTGWLLRNEYILRTTNGGNSFDSTYEVFSYMWDIFFKDPLNGVLCGDGTLIMKSTDGGINWIQIQIPLYNFGIPDLKKESFVGNYGWVIGQGPDYNLGSLCWRTTNFGLNWDTISRVPYPSNPTVVNYCVFFSSLNTGWCGGSYGYIFKTTNSGYNWNQQNTPSINFRGSMWFYSDSIGWAVGGYGQIVNTTNGGTYINVKPISDNIPDRFNLSQNYPNPFNPSTKINYQIQISGFVNITLYDVLGRKVADLVNEKQNAGTYEVEFDGTNFASGIYFYKLETESFSESKKMVLMK